MTAYWLTYKPLSASSPRGWPAEELSALVQSFEADPAGATPLWRIAAYKSAQVGDRVFVFKQGADPRGIFGVGEIIEAPRLQLDPTDIEQGLRHRAKVRFDRLVDPQHKFLIEFDAISEIVPKELISAQASGTEIPDDVAAELEKLLYPLMTTLPPIGNEQADDPSFDPDSVKDERERAMRAIRIRRGQPKFRAALLQAYGRRCAITGCAVEDVLEAAHITPYLGRYTNDTSNGLLLRTDIHTLFDCGLMAIEPISRTVVVAETLKSSTYGQFAGRTLRPPKNVSSAPSRRNLEKRYDLFEAIHGPGPKAAAG